MNGAPLAADHSGKDVKKGQLTVSGHALYEVVNQPQPQNSLLDLTVDDPGVELYVFTFGE